MEVKKITIHLHTTYLVAHLVHTYKPPKMLPTMSNFQKVEKYKNTSGLHTNFEWKVKNLTQH